MWIALVLLTATVIISSSCLLILTNFKNEFDKEFDTLYEMTLNGDKENTAEYSKYVTEKWLDKHLSICQIVRHTQMDQVTLAVSRLESLALYGENGELAAEIMRCKILLDEIWESEIPNFRNIF